MAELSATESAASPGGDRGVTQELLLDAALAVFTERTFSGAAVSLVAERAGVSVGTLYRYFPSKDALGNAVFGRWKRRLLEPLVWAGELRGSAREEFGQVWDALRRFATDSPDAFAFLEFQQHESYLDAENRALAAAVEAASADFVVRGQHSGEIRPGNPAMLVALALGAFVGLGKAIRAGLVLDQAQVVAAEEAAWGLLRSP